MSQREFDLNKLSDLIIQLNAMKRSFDNVSGPLCNVVNNWNNSLQPLMIPYLQMQNKINTATEAIRANTELIEGLKNAVRLADNMRMILNARLEPFLKYYINNQEQVHAILAGIQQASIKIDFDKIDFDKFNELYNNDDLNDGELSESDLQDINVALIESTDGTTINLIQFVNKLLELELILPNKRQLVFGIVYFVFTTIIMPYCNDVISYVYPPESIQLFRELRSARLNEANQSALASILPSEFKNVKIVRVHELNVRSEPNIDAAIIGGLCFGWNVKVLNTNGNWVFVQWHGVEGIGIQGWVNSRYLADIKSQIE